MKRVLAITTAFVLGTLVFAMAQQPGGAPYGGSSGQSTSPGSQMPGQQQPSTPGAAGQNAPEPGGQTGMPSQAANAPVTEGCLGGSSPNFTITDSSGKTYKLNIPPNADASVLNPHVGESVQVQGDVKQAGNANTIDVSRVGRGTSKCPGSSAQPTPK
ncbi:MAG TPA: hypothetical protein VMU24_05070 [Candidatus Acidoferrales bacterium]|nr:hypothetical protein [Candidatus Acidoferrales bacterium]